MINLKENIKRIRTEIKKSILNSNYKNEEMYVITYKKYIDYKTVKFFIAQPQNVGKINSRNITVEPIYENGMLIGNILIKSVLKIGEFYFKYSDEAVRSFIENMDFNLSHHTYKYLLGDYKSIARSCHKFNYKSRMKMIESNFNDESVKHYLMLCKERNWDCNYGGVKR